MENKEGEVVVRERVGDNGHWERGGDKWRVRSLREAGEVERDEGHREL